MDLYGAALTVRMILQSASGGMKGVPDRHIEVLVHLAIDHQLVAGHGQVDTHLVRPPFAVVANRGLHHDPAADDPIVKLLQLGGPLSDIGLNRLGRRDVA